MNWKKHLKHLVWALAVPMLFVACDDDDNPGGGGDDDQNFRAESGVYVFNQGNQSAGIGGALSFIDPSTASYRNDVFLLVNGRELGSMLQDGVVLGDNLYIAVNGSNTVEVVNKNTVQSVAQIPTPSDLGGPRDVVTDGEYVYASMYGGYVVRIDPATNEIDNTVQVGPNPEEMAVLGNHLYVVNSDGMNWPPADCSVSKINLDDFTEVKKIEVGNNPNKIVAHAASGKLFVACWGDFYNNPNSLWTIDAASDEATDLQVSVTFMCISGDVLYTIYDSYNGPESVQYVAYNAEDNSVLDDTFIPTVTSNNDSEYNRVDSPAGITVNPADGHIFIASYVDDPVNAYTLPSYVYEYNAQGEVQRRYDVGVGAANMLVLE